MISFHIPQLFPRLRLAALATVVLLLLSACATPGPEWGTPFYKGPVLKVGLTELLVRLDDGKDLSFGKVFAGFEPDNGFWLRRMPFEELDINIIPYRTAADALQRYDANDNGIAEEPELALLFVVEAAKGLGYPVASVGINPRATALDLAPKDTSALVRYVKAKRTDMNADAQKLFFEMDLIERDEQTRGSEGLDREQICNGC